MYSLFSNLNELLDEVFSELPSYRSANADPIHLEYELAGVKKDEIKVSIEEGCLKIGVESKRRKGARVISLSRLHDTDKATVKYEDGLLTVDIPIRKLEKKEQKLLQIQ